MTFTSRIVHFQFLFFTVRKQNSNVEMVEATMTASDADDSKPNLLAVTTISTAATTTTKSKIKVSTAKPYLCKTCGNGFKSYSNLLIHSRIHTGS